MPLEHYFLSWSRVMTFILPEKDAKVSEQPSEKKYCSLRQLGKTCQLRGTDDAPNKVVLGMGSN